MPRNWVLFTLVVGVGVMMAKPANHADPINPISHTATYRFWAARFPPFADLFTDDYSYNRCLSLIGTEVKDKNQLVANCRTQHQVKREYVLDKGDL